MKKSNLYISAGAIVLLFLLMVTQQLLMPRTVKGKPKSPIQKADLRIMTASEAGLTYRPNHSPHIVYTALFHASRNQHEKAQKWFQLGAGEFRLPAVMVFYGDYLVCLRRYNAARHWYDLAEFYARQRGEKNILPAVRSKRAFLDASEKRELKK